MLLDVFTVAIAGASLALSTLALWLRHRDQGRALFTASWATPSSIRLVNQGEGIARRVTVEIRSSSSRITDTFATDQWGPSQAVPVRVTRAIAVEHGPVRVEWNDARRPRQQLDIPLGPPPQAISPHNPGEDRIEEIVRRIAQREYQHAREWEERRDDRM